MICPKCKEKNTAEARVCTNCGLKLKTVCPRCKTPNKLGQAKCTNCNLTLIRFCPACRAPNFPNVENCRKCGAEIRKKPPASKKTNLKKPAAETQPPEKPVVEPGSSKEPAQDREIIQETVKEPGQKKVARSDVAKEQAPPQEQASPPPQAPPSEQETPSREEIKPDVNLQDNFKMELARNDAAILIQEMLVKSDKGYLLGLCGPNGIGKSMITSSLTRNVKDKQLIWLVGQSEPCRKNIPYAFFKDVICTLFGVPLTDNTDHELTKSQLKKTFEENLGITDEKVLNVVFRIVLNDYKECAETLEENQRVIQESILKIINALRSKAPIVLVAEDFEYIDKASFDCIKFLLKNGFLENKNFMIINHNHTTNLAKLFPEEVSAKKFLLIMLKYLTNDELNRILLSMMNDQDIIPEGLKYKIFKQSKGLPIYVEQALWYLFQAGAIYMDEKSLKFNPQFKDIDIIPDFTELISHRLEMIEKLSPEAERVIFTAAVYGFKFLPGLIHMVAEVEEQKMQEILQNLVNSGIFAVIDQQALAFKHINLWQTVFERAINQEKIAQISAKMLSVLHNDASINSAFLARLADYAGNRENMILYCNNAVQESLCLGDRLTYTDNQMKVYERIPESNLSEEEKQAAKLNISEQIGKINYELNPSIAIKHLTNNIDHYIELGDSVKLIELIGYLSKSYELMGDFTGVLECAEKAAALTKKPEKSPEVMLLGFSGMDANYNLGRLQEAIICAQDELLPFLDRAISKNETLPGLSIDELKTIEYETELILAKSLTFQGNKQAIEVLNKIATRAEKENQQEYLLKSILWQALFSIIQGNLRTCHNFLESIEEKGLSVNKLSETKLLWLFISILSNMMSGNFEQARNTCYSTLSLAKETRNYNLFAILKLLSGYFYQYFQYYKNAITIYEETANYCSESKMATGALYAWYFAAEAELQTGNPDKAKEIAEKAIDVSQKPNINNFPVTILLSRLLAEIKIIKGDFEGAQINIESALNLAEDNELYYFLIELYISLGKIYQETSSVKEDRKDYICSCAYRAYTKAYSFAEKINNDFLLQKVEKVLTNLNTFCKLSGITIEK